MPARTEPYDAPAIVTFAEELTVWREAAELNKKQLADALGYADSYVGQVERCKNIPSPEFAEALDTFFKTNRLFKRLWKRIIDTRHLAVLPPGFTQFLDREAEATQVRAFNLALINGLLQTENYARAVVGANQQPDIVDQLVSDRLKRQTILTREDPLHAWFTVDEVALRKMIGGPDVMCEQLEHLLTISERPNVWLDVVPQDAGYYPGLGGDFIILGFPNAPDIAYIEAGGHGMVIQEPRAVAHCSVQHNLLRGDALRVEESLALIRSLMKEIKE